MDKLDKLFLINLEKRKDRLVHFVKEVTREKIPFEKIDVYKPIDGTTDTYEIPDNYKNLFSNANYMKTKFKNTISSNQLSHYSILKLQIERNYKNIIVFQDDVVLKNGFLNDLENIMNNLPNNYEIIWIGLHKFAVYDQFVPWNINGDYDEKDFIEENYNNYIGISNTNRVNPASLSYIVSLEGARNYIKYIEENGFSEATDHNYNNYLRNKKIMYFSRKVLCTGNNKFGSDIFSNKIILG
jgi:GR25 family glycosyltransferase involved in LPS biosynthesis